MTRILLALPLLGGCGLASDIGLEDTGSTQVEQAFPLPEDLHKVEWESVFTDAVNLLVTVNTQGPFLAHRSTMDTRAVGCPDFYLGEFTVGLMTVGDTEGVSWFDDCLTADDVYYDGWLWWETDVVEFGDPDTDDGRTSDAYRRMEGDALVGDPDGVRLEFDGVATDALYRLQASYDYERYVYSTSIDGTITGRDVFEGSLTPRGYRTDLVMYVTGGDIDIFEARGNVYMFDAQLQDRFDSIEVDMAMVGPAGAAPGDCTLEPLGWIGVRDPNAYWYDVVFQPRAVEDLIDPYVNPDLSFCDGCGRLYVQGVEQVGVDVCIDFSFLFEDGGFPVPDADDFVLPLRSL